MTIEQRMIEALADDIRNMRVVLAAREAELAIANEKLSELLPPEDEPPLHQ